MKTIQHKIEIQVRESFTAGYKAVQYSIREGFGAVYVLPFIQNSELKGYLAYHTTSKFTSDQLHALILKAQIEQAPSGFVDSYPLPYSLFTEDEIDNVLSRLIVNNTTTDLSKNVRL